MGKNHVKFLEEIIKTSHDIWSKGWAERNAGNISVRLKPEDLDDKILFNFEAPWKELGKIVHGIENEFFLVSGTGKYIRNIEIEPQKNLGIIQIDETGGKYKVIWGYSDGGQPTSELPAHLLAHSVRKRVSGGADRAIIHTHPANIIALTYALDLDTCSLTKLLWEMHAECIVVFPEGVEFIPWIMAGSSEIADATAKAFEKRSIAVWQFHGVFAAGQDLDAAFGLIDTAEKAAYIYFKVISAGKIRKKPTLTQLKSIAENFKANLDYELFDKIYNMTE